MTTKASGRDGRELEPQNASHRCWVAAQHNSAGNSGALKAGAGAGADVGVGPDHKYFSLRGVCLLHAALSSGRYYRGALGAIIVYDMTDPNSFQHARGWYGQLKTLGEAGVQVALVGNKADLEPRKVPEETAAEFASQNGLTHHVTSAKNGLNVEAVFEDLARRMPQDTAAPSADTVILLPNKGKSSCAC